jgi:cytosine/adenosine deaminase-related metal-dependent hydrolase
MADLLLRNARMVATVDAQRRELAGGWVAITDNLIEAVGGSADPQPAATRTIDVADCLVTPGLVNAHHHIYQNLTRAYPPMTDKPLFGWLQSLYPLWRAIDEESVYASAFVGLAELALSGCTTSTDHLYLHPRGAGDLLSAEIAAARELGMRFHPTRGSMSLSQKDGGLPPDDVVADDDEILAASEAAVHQHHDRSHGAMVRIALAPCSPFSVTERADGGQRRAGRAARRAAAHALRRERRGRRVLAGHLRLPADGVPGAHRLVQRPHVGGALRDAQPRRGASPRALPASAWRTAPAATSSSPPASRRWSRCARPG